MDINKYFDEVQNKLKSDPLKYGEITDKDIKKLKRKNIQALINQNFNNNVSIDETVKDVFNMIKSDNIPLKEPNQLMGDRDMNRNESFIKSFNDFVNESLESSNGVRIVSKSSHDYGKRKAEYWYIYTEKLV